MNERFQFVEGYFSGDGGPFSMWWDESVLEWEGAYGSGQYDELLSQLPSFKDDLIFQRITVGGITANLFLTLDCQFRVATSSDKILLTEVQPTVSSLQDMQTNEDEENLELLQSITIETGDLKDVYKQPVLEATRIYIFPAARGFEEVREECISLPLNRKSDPSLRMNYLGPGFSCQLRPGKLVIYEMIEERQQNHYRGLILCWEKG